MTLSDWLAAALAPAEDTTPPKRPPRRTEPLLMGDILTARLDHPEFLRRWQDEADKEDP